MEAARAEAPPLETSLRAFLGAAVSSHMSNKARQRVPSALERSQLSADRCHATDADAAVHISGRGGGDCRADGCRPDAALVRDTEEDEKQRAVPGSRFCFPPYFPVPRSVVLICVSKWWR